MGQAKKHILPFFIPHLGCPHQCIFCNQYHVSGSSGFPQDNEIAQAIQDWERAELPEIAFYGGSFSGLDFSWQRYFLTPAYQALKENKISGIRISTRPDYINPQVLAFLRSFGVATVELGVQSMDDQILASAKRGHSAKEVLDALNLLKKEGFTTGVQLMPGLPGDNRAKCLQGALILARLQPDLARIYPTVVLKNTLLHKLFLEDSYQPLNLPEAVEISKDMLAIFRLFGVQVIRTGLQPTKDLAPGGEMVAGPFHPAFGELVAAALVREHLIFVINSFLKERDEKIIILWGSPQDCSLIAGHKKSNMQFLQDHFQLSHIKIMGSSSLDRGNFGISMIDSDQPEFVVSEKHFLHQYVNQRLNLI
ncbi:MAG: elongator complex protein 3 [Dehalobacterium sp.]|jgi:histone acetyltransferase (RNA polymerase elongator complex component)